MNTYKGLFRLLTLVITSVFAPHGHSTVILSDEFNDGALSGDWNISLENASGWSFAENAGRLQVSDIQRISLEQWATVNLTQDIALDNFDASVSFSWDSAGSVRAMQSASLMFFDDLGGIVATIGFRDSWELHTGGIGAWSDASATSYFSGIYSVGLSGSALLGVSRIDDMFDFTWNGNSVWSYQDDREISSVGLQFGFFPRNNSRFTSRFGSESIDFIRVVETPEPSVLALIGMGFIVLGRRKIKQFLSRSN